MTPFPITNDNTAEEKKYNYYHSRTRIIVEQAFGLYKGKFRIFQAPLCQESPHAMAQIIDATMILHNWFIDLNDTDDIFIEQWMHIGGDDIVPSAINIVGGDDAIQRREILENIIWNLP